MSAVGPGGQDYAGPRIGDRAQLGGIVVELAAHGGVAGAVVDVGGGAAPVWLPVEVLTLGGARARFA